MTYFFEKDASFYAKLIKSKKISVTSIVENCLDLIENYDIYNSVIHIQKKFALDDAKQKDLFIASLKKEEIKNLPDFFGVPILLKDLGQEQINMPSTSASRILKNNIASKTDNFVKKLMELGFVIVGRTNASEFGLKMISDSAYYGSVVSVFNKNKNAGGSSGGSATALKAGLIPIAAASDGGGSIRVPASYNGLIGLKPSRGKMPLGPNNYRSWQGASVNFAITKSIKDTFRLFKGLETSNMGYPFSLESNTKTRLRSLNKKLRIAYFTDPLIGNYLSKDAVLTVEKAKDFLQEKGHELVLDRPLLDYKKMMEDYYLVTGVEMAASMDKLEVFLNRKILFEEISPMAWAWWKMGKSISGTKFSNALERWDNYTYKINKFFDNYNLILSPVSSGCAPNEKIFDLSSNLLNRIKNIDKLDKNQRTELVWKGFGKLLEYSSYPQFVNLCGACAISLPIYENKDKLPLGVQFVARRNQDYLLLQVGKLFEDNNLLNSKIIKAD